MELISIASPNVYAVWSQFSNAISLIFFHILLKQTKNVIRYGMSIISMLDEQTYTGDTTQNEMKWQKTKHMQLQSFHCHNTYNFTDSFFFIFCSK